MACGHRGAREDGARRQPRRRERHAARGRCRPLMKQPTAPSTGRATTRRRCCARSTRRRRSRRARRTARARGATSIGAHEEGTLRGTRPARSSPRATARSCARRSTARCGSRTCGRCPRTASRRSSCRRPGAGERARRRARDRRSRSMRPTRGPPGARSATRSTATVGVLHFEFHNGAMSTAQCQRLLAAIRFAQGAPDEGAGARRAGPTSGPTAST